MTLNQKLDWLIDQWCERRALKPLRYLLPANHNALVHTDQFGALLDSLRDVKGLCRSDLSSEELTLVISAINELEDFMNARRNSNKKLRELEKYVKSCLKLNSIGGAPQNTEKKRPNIDENDKINQLKVDDSSYY